MDNYGVQLWRVPTDNISSLFSNALFVDPDRST